MPSVSDKNAAGIDSKFSFLLQCGRYRLAKQLLGMMNSVMAVWAEFV